MQFKALRLILIAFITYLVLTYGVQPIQIYGKTLEPDLKESSWQLLIKPWYQFTPLKINDYVAVKLTGASVYLVARVAGLPGEKITIKNSELTSDSGYKSKIANYRDREISLASDEIFLAGNSEQYLGKETSPVTGVIKIDRVAGKLL